MALDLKPRELEILRMRCRGNTADEMALKFDRNQQTIKNTLSRIYTKTGVKKVIPANRGYRACYILGRHEERAAILTRVRESKENGVHRGWNQGESL